MRDIGRLQDRIENLEFSALLERDAGILKYKMQRT